MRRPLIEVRIYSKRTVVPNNARLEESDNEITKSGRQMSYSRLCHFTRSHVEAGLDGKDPPFLDLSGAQEVTKKSMPRYMSSLLQRKEFEPQVSFFYRFAKISKYSSTRKQEGGPQK